MPYAGTEIDRGIAEHWRPPAGAHDTHLPGTRDAVVARLGEQALADLYTQVDGPDGLWVPTESLRSGALVATGAGNHPRGIGYRVDALTRLRHVLDRHPDWTGAAWSSASAWGMRYFCDDADTCVLSGGRRRLAQTADQVTRQRREGLVATVEPVSVDSRCRSHRVTPPVLTLAHCLQSVLRGEHRWTVPGVGWIDDRDLRLVQVLDMFSAHFGVPPVELAAGCHGLVDARLTGRLAELADQGGESPTETVLRLAVQEMDGTSGLVPQLVVHADGSVGDPVHDGTERWGKRRRRPQGVRRTTTGPSVIARLDLGDPGLKLGLQYDGAAHLGLERRDRDSVVNTRLANLGWHILRITYGHLTDPDLLAETVRDGVALCRRRQGL